MWYNLAEGVVPSRDRLGPPDASADRLTSPERVTPSHLHEGYPMNRAKVLDLIRRSGQVSEAAVKQLEGLTDADSIKKWQKDNRVDTDGDLAAVLLKTVTISVSADAGEDVVVEDGTPTETEAMDEDGEEPEESKSVDNRPRYPRNQKRWGLSLGSTAGTKSAGSMRNVSAKSMYDRAVREGGTFKGKRPEFDSADACEAFGAYARLTAMGAHEYKFKAADRDIVQKALGTTLNSEGGALDPDLFSATLIELKGRYGATRMATGVTPMQDGDLTMPRLTTDITVYKTAQGAASTESEPAFDNVTLNASELTAIVRSSKVLLNDSAINVGDTIARSFARAFGKYEDDNFLTTAGAANGWSGIASVVGANSTYDAALSSSWADYTAAKVASWIGQLPGVAWREGRVGIICNYRFYASVLRGLLSASAGGRGANDYIGNAIGRADAGAVGDFDGIPVYFTDSLPATYTADQLVAYIGAWDAGCKFGEVTGSTGIETSDQRYFEYRQIAFMGTERVAWNPHNVSNTTDSLVVALKD